MMNTIQTWDKVIGVQFAVEIGNRFALGITQQPESAHGGSVVGNQSALAIIDQGGNIVTDVNEGTVNVSLLKKTMIDLLECISVRHILNIHLNLRCDRIVDKWLERSCFEYLLCGYWISSAYSASPRRFL